MPAPSQIQFTPSWRQRLRATWALGIHGAKQAWEIALQTNDTAMCAVLERLGVSARDVSVHTILGCMEQHQNPTAMRCVLRSGANPNTRHPNGHCGTLLHRACARGDLDIVRVLVEEGANQNERCGNGFTPLESALSGWGVVKGPLERRTCVAHFLLSNGSDATAVQGHEGRSLLVSAGPNLELAQALLDRGAPVSWSAPSTPETLGPAAAHSASLGPTHILFSVFDGDHPASVGHMRRWLGVMTRSGVDVRTATNEYGYTLIQEWVRRGVHARSAQFVNVQDMCTTLVSFGADPCATTPDGDTLWHIACLTISSRSEDLLGALSRLPGLHQQADETNKKGLTPLQVLEDTADDIPRDEEASKSAIVGVMRAIINRSEMDHALATPIRPFAPSRRRM